MIDNVAGIDIERLKEVASNATPGPWGLYGGNSLVVVTGEPRKEDIGAHSKNNNIFQTWQEANAAYIATASPDVVLSLIKQLESLQGIVLAAFQALGGNCTSTDAPADLPKRIRELVLRHNGLLCANGDLNQEADWLADKLSCACSVSTDDKCGIPTPCPNNAGCACLDVEAKDWREAAHKAISGGQNG